jgi:hypothetical protein
MKDSISSNALSAPMSQKNQITAKLVEENYANQRKNLIE